jgi:ABC-2 type transport system permease protein
MTPRITLAVATRVLTQLRRDHRTLALLLVMPCVILALLWWMFGSSPAQGAGFDALGPPLLALIPFIVMFLVTSVTTLRERSSGTLERLLAMPTGKGDLLGGYARSGCSSWSPWRTPCSAPRWACSSRPSRARSSRPSSSCRRS